LTRSELEQHIKIAVGRGYDGVTGAESPEYVLCEGGRVRCRDVLDQLDSCDAV